MPEPKGWDVARFSDTLKALIEKDGRTDSAIARAVPCDTSYVGQLKRGEVPSPGIGILCGLAATLGVTLGHLVGVDPPAPSSEQPFDIHAKAANALKEHVQRYGCYLTRAQQEEAIRLLVTAINVLYDEQEIAETLPIGAICQVDPNAGCPQPSDRRGTPSRPRYRKKSG